ncbi:hypothetical protein PISMIDRAFT_464661 [Pisolithus microcarpus 441]|uniref:Uncharacterized protein n=1 Tax=Pisolithus microcarpus 441 TaxID=765257 RepID=A0A0C9YE23_9AGAM|nr:hypothetical protein PISMIDRAFT_464661 [Pisolithus microcarpus 441]
MARVCFEVSSISIAFHPQPQLNRSQPRVGKCITTQTSLMAQRSFFHRLRSQARAMQNTCACLPSCGTRQSAGPCAARALRG